MQDDASLGERPIRAHHLFNARLGLRAIKALRGAASSEGDQRNDRYEPKDHQGTQSRGRVGVPGDYQKRELARTSEQSIPDLVRHVRLRDVIVVRTRLHAAGRHELFRFVDGQVDVCAVLLEPCALR